MKLNSIFSNIKNVVIAVLIGIVVWQSEFKHYEAPVNMTLVETVWLDSLENFKGDTTISIDTSTVPFIPITIEHKIIPEEELVDGTITYIDTVDTDEIFMRFQGILDTQTYKLSTKYDFNLKVPKIIEKHIVITQPPIVINKPALPKRQLFINGGIGGNSEIFVPSVGITFITKKDNLYGLDLSFINNKKILQIKLGYKLF